jgi:hypothetical protein
VNRKPGGLFQAARPRSISFILMDSEAAGVSLLPADWLVVGLYMVAVFVILFLIGMEWVMRWMF